MVTISEFIVVGMGARMLMWSEHTSVHILGLVSCDPGQFSCFSGKRLTRLLLLHEKVPELYLEAYSKFHMAYRNSRGPLTLRKGCFEFILRGGH